MDFELKQLDISNIDMIKNFFVDVFSNEPWNDITQIFLQTERNVPAYHFYKKNEFIELAGHVSFAKEIRL